jgi:hypothetical protein
MPLDFNPIPVFLRRQTILEEPRMTTPIEALRANLVHRSEHCHDQLAEWTRELAIAEGQLKAHDEAVEALRAERADAPGGRLALGPAERAPKRNIGKMILEHLSRPGGGWSVEMLVAEIGGISESRMLATLGRLGDKVAKQPDGRWAKTA